jgi:hypothetical protein
MEFISIGPYCATSDILKEQNVRINSYPFDYLFSSLEIVKHAINNRFNIFLDKEYYTKGTNENSTRHQFYCKLLDTEILYRHHIKHDYAEDYKVSNGNFFNHHNLIDDEKVYNTFKRRCNRLLKLIDNNEKIVFVYYNCYTADFGDLIDFYKNFEKNKNIYVIGIFENGFMPAILYENSNCKIYQNINRRSIMDDIKTIVSNQIK